MYLAFMILLCGLGFWQLGRAEEKRQFLQKQQEALTADAVSLAQLKENGVDALRYRKISVIGHYDYDHQFLLDNQIMDSAPGYFVLTPFLLDDEKNAVLVNRGWIALGKRRTELPDLGPKPPVSQVTGRINQFSRLGIKLKGAEIPTAGWPAVVQLVDKQMLAARLNQDLLDFQIELNAEAVEGFKRDWKIVTAIPPEKHIAYAVQWFGLALTLTGLYFWISIRKQSEHST